MLTHERTETTQRWSGTFHGQPLDLRVRRDPEYPAFWCWERWAEDRRIASQTCISETEAIRQAFEWLACWRDD